MVEVFNGWRYIPENCNMERDKAESSTFVEDRTVHIW
jgi:hypothetical protein